ncbi:transglycosylase family protein [Glutamicibacter nicotianae]|uniref:transglycosylase family protein n=1 Tax=Glutamicibacter nicotianae TaxID=37929 RepID=UPI00255679D8|nr:transglycosylase family protein [Glutamicibacter nicotianae]WIV44649.1 transglycosylase family protein [Glutamicibacter nicotianae]
MIQQKTKNLIRRGGASLAAVAVAGTAIVAATAPANAASTWDKLAQCESGGNWSINTGNGYYGGLQFSLSTWKAFGGSGMPHQASKAEQIRIATKVQASQGWGAWPACTAKLGISGSPSGSSTPQKQAPKQQAAPKQQSAPTQKQAPKQQAAPKHAAPAPKAPVFNIDVTDSGKDYTVKSGDTLAKIADKLGVKDWRGLFVLNDDQLSNPDYIMVGQTLNVPAN